VEVRQAKAKEKEIRCQAMAAARLAREKEKAEKAEKAARRTYQRLKQALKTS
jgi:hypothetical protein